MKKLALIIAVAGMIGLSSCSKGTECSITTIGIKTTITVDDGQAKTCILTACNTTDVVGTDADYIASLEDAGYTCK